MYQYASIGRDIMIIHKYFKMFFKHELKKYQLNTAEAMVLLALYEQDGKTDEEILTTIHNGRVGKTQDQIIGELHYDKSVMARTMQSLENKGYILRNINPQDNRSYVFTLTEQATSFKPKLIAILRQWNDSLLADIDDLAALKRIMDKMAFNAHDCAAQKLLI